MKIFSKRLPFFLFGCIFLYGCAAASNASKTIAYLNKENINYIDISQTDHVSDLEKIEVWVVPDSTENDFEEECRYYQRIKNIPLGSSRDEVSKIINSFKFGAQKSYADLLSKGISLNEIVENKITVEKDYEKETVTTHKIISETNFLVESKFVRFHFRAPFYSQAVLVKLLEIKEVYVGGILVSLSSSPFFGSRDLYPPDKVIIANDGKHHAKYSFSDHEKEIFFKKSSPESSILWEAKAAMTWGFSGSANYDNEEINFYAREIYTLNDLLGNELASKLEYGDSISKQISLGKIKEMIDAGHTDLSPYYFERKYSEK